MPISQLVGAGAAGNDPLGVGFPVTGLVVALFGLGADCPDFDFPFFGRADASNSVGVLVFFFDWLWLALCFEVMVIWDYSTNGLW